MLLITKLITLAIICVAFILGVGNTNTANATETDIKTTATLTNNSTTSEEIIVKVDSTFEDNHKLLIINSPNYDNISIEKLQRDIGVQNVVTDANLNQITVNLKDVADNSFQLYFHNTKKAEVKISDIRQNELDDESFIKENPWREEKKLRVSYGNSIQKQSDGSEIKPVLYFGSITQALNGGSDINQAIKKIKPKVSRVNNITAANNGIMVIKKNGDKVTKNVIYTNTSGDGTIVKNGKEIDDDKQSLNNFITTNLYDYSSPINTETPKISGPDFDYKKHTAKIKNAVFSTRISALTNTEEQRLRFTQYYSKQPNFQIQIEIVQSFTANNAVKTSITYTNVGNNIIANFTGYLFKNITINKLDGSNITTSKDNIDFLQNRNGIYSRSSKLGTDLQLSFDSVKDSPYAWSLTTDKPTYFGKELYPFDPNIPGNFSNVEDKAFASNKLDEIWLLNKFKPSQRTLALHTKNKTLNINDKSSMSFTSEFNIKPDISPHVSLNKFPEHKPDKISNDSKYYEISGTWFDHVNEDIDLFYLVDDNNLANAKMLPNEVHVENNPKGTINNWKGKIPVSSLSAGQIHKIKVFAQPKTNFKSNILPKYRSDIHETHFQINSIKDKKPVINISEPSLGGSNWSHVFEKDKIDFSGTWINNDPDDVQLSYQINNEEPIIFDSSAKNNNHGRPNTWKLHIPFSQLPKADGYIIFISITSKSGESNTALFFPSKKITLRSPKMYPLILVQWAYFEGIIPFQSHL